MRSRSGGARVTIDFVSDVTCPWCAIGLAGLEQAIERLGTEPAVRLNIQARCVNTNAPATLHVHLETHSRLVFDSGVPIFLDPGDNGYVQRLGLPFQVQTPGPFFDLEGADAV